MLFLVLTEDGPDLICEDKKTANAHIFDLRAMGFKPSVQKFPTWEALYAKHPNA